eukprot:CAMPEP_0196153174 /NCGR_PEP_ID=MMETSP0910-20130528/36743_1 /TAXON_ID=49265 /ORGANISM="Thalassiosira rotula, Strain GSO102" /LENGTH=49 /DNA_ID=CAMNT_0041416923 /DNA_START=271 /DNA_END=420 /DNA_ORIENTATION=-
MHDNDARCCIRQSVISFDAPPLLSSLVMVDVVDAGDADEDDALVDDDEW